MKQLPIIPIAWVREARLRGARQLAHDLTAQEWGARSGLVSMRWNCNRGDFGGATRVPLARHDTNMVGPQGPQPCAHPTGPRQLWYTRRTLPRVQIFTHAEMQCRK